MSKMSDAYEELVTIAENAAINHSLLHEGGKPPQGNTMLSILWIEIKKCHVFLGEQKEYIQKLEARLEKVEGLTTPIGANGLVIVGDSFDLDKAGSTTLSVNPVIGDTPVLILRSTTNVEAEFSVNPDPIITMDKPLNDAGITDPKDVNLTGENIAVAGVPLSAHFVIPNEGRHH